MAELGKWSKGPKVPFVTSSDFSLFLAFLSAETGITQHLKPFLTTHFGNSETWQALWGQEQHHLRLRASRVLA